MSDTYTYVVKCLSGYNKEACPYLKGNAIESCAVCTGATYIRRNRQDYAWQYEKNEEKQHENEENQTN